MKGFSPKWSVADFSSLINTRTGSLIVPVFMMALLLFSPLLSSIAVAITVHVDQSYVNANANEGSGETETVKTETVKTETVKTETVKTETVKTETVALGNNMRIRGNMMMQGMQGNGNMRVRGNMMMQGMQSNDNMRVRGNMMMQGMQSNDSGMRGKGMRGKGMRAKMQVFDCLVSMYGDGGDMTACGDSMHTTSADSHLSFNGGGSAWFASPALSNLPDHKALSQHIAYVKQHIPSVFLEISTPPPEQT